MTIAYIDVAKAPVETFPRQLFFGGSQGGFYNPSDRATLFQDTAGTIPVTADGQPVALMLDKSGRGNHLMQAVLAARPIYRSNGVLHWLEGDGVDDFMSGPSIALALNMFVACAMQVLSADGSATGGNSFGMMTGTAFLYFGVRSQGAIFNPSWGFRRQGTPGSPAVPNAAPGRDTPHITDAQSSASGAALDIYYRDGVGFSYTGSATGVTGGAPSAAIGLFTTVAVARRFYGGLLVDRLLTASERALVRNYYAGKAGVVL